MVMCRWKKFRKHLRRAIIEEIKNVHILGIRSKTQITKKILDAAKKLQAIGCFCIGVNQVDLKGLQKMVWWFLMHPIPIQDL